MPNHVGFDALLAALTAAGEATRLRLLALLAEAELTVSELVTILGQSQPRVSRHLKLLVESGLAQRHREGAWVFFRIAQTGQVADFARDLIARLSPPDANLAADRARLAEVRQARAEQAARYFAAQAGNWDELRAMHVPEERVEAAIRKAAGQGPVHALLDLGTGTGRMLELLGPLAAHAVGIDQSPQMLSIARVRIERGGLRNVQLRQGDIYAVPAAADSYDLVVMHQVLHYLDDPLRAIREAARVLRPGGRLLIADFAPHEEEALRTSHAHRRLGFAREEVAGFLVAAGLDLIAVETLLPKSGESGQLAVSLWLGRDRRIIADPLPLTARVVA
ncbi:MAG TPA: metalloregulator ArsR/SmtB family transcription factor [Methylocella sp.]|nr:metalloregulator ArsR/SmtB family transcription factor [Methylocella sp.]